MKDWKKYISWGITLIAIIATTFQTCSKDKAVKEAIEECLLEVAVWELQARRSAAVLDSLLAAPIQVEYIEREVIKKVVVEKPGPTVVKDADPQVMEDLRIALHDLANCNVAIEHKEQLLDHLTEAWSEMNKERKITESVEGEYFSAWVEVLYKGEILQVAKGGRSDEKLVERTTIVEIPVQAPVKKHTLSALYKTYATIQNVDVNDRKVETTFWGHGPGVMYSYSPNSFLTISADGIYDLRAKLPSAQLTAKVKIF